MENYVNIHYKNWGDSYKLGIRLGYVHFIKEIVFSLAHFPPITRVLLHIGYGIFLINNFESKQSFDNIFKSYNAVDSTIFINNQCDMLFGFK